MSDITPFDYSQASSAAMTGEFVQEAADTIHQVRGEAIVLIGEQLAAVKSRPGPTGFGGEVARARSSLGRSAPRATTGRCSRRFGSFPANSAEVSRKIDRSAQYLLASVSYRRKSVRDEALAKAAAGERVTHRWIQLRVTSTRLILPVHVQDGPTTRLTSPVSV